MNDAGVPSDKPGYAAAEARPAPFEPGEGRSGPGAGAPGWGPGRVAIGIVVLLVTTVFEVGIVSAFDPGLDSLGARLVTQAMLAITLIVVAFTLTADPRHGIASAPVMGLRRPVRAPFGLDSALGPTVGAFVAAAIAYFAYIVAAAVYSSLTHPEQKDITRDLGFGHGGWGTVAAALLIVAAAPVAEEIFFRGFIFGGFRGRFSFATAALISAAIFGVFHYTGAGSLGVVPQLAFLGFALAWVYEETGSIYPTMAIHATNNLLAFVILTS